MTYLRVIPRDLFNEGNLLKCYGQLHLNLEKMGMEDCLVYEDGGPFRVIQDQSDGSTYLSNVQLIVRGEVIPLRRPLNSREPYPLWVYLPDGEFQVFDDDGSFTPDMVAFLRGEDSN